MFRKELRYVHKMTKACDISQAVKKVVWERDNHCCVICGSSHAFPNAHYIRRSQGGLGIEQNVVTLCMNCHEEFDNGSGLYGQSIKEAVRDYLQEHYDDWNEKSLVYNKWREYERI